VDSRGLKADLYGGNCFVWISPADDLRLLLFFC